MGKLKKKRLNKPVRSVKQDKKADKALVIFLGLLMVGSVFGVLFYGVNDGQSDTAYNGFKIKQTTLGYEVKVDGENYLFQTHPSNLELLDLTYLDEILSKGAFILSFDPNNQAVSYLDAARITLAQTAYSKGIVYSEGVTKKSDLYPLDVITCKDATQDMPVIIFEESNETSINYSDNCLEIIALAYIEAQYIQALQYKVLGVMK